MIVSLIVEHVCKPKNCEITLKPREKVGESLNSLLIIEKVIFYCNNI